MVRLVACLILSLALPTLAGLATARAEPRHGLALFDDLKYGPDFAHFDYVEPDAPKGGVLRRATIGSFDNLNPFILKGEAAVLAGLPFESLLESSADEPDAAYGLIAETVELAADRSWVRFSLRPEARWHDGTAITADDVVFSFETLVAKGDPRYRIELAGVDRVERTADGAVVFHLGDLQNRKLPLIVANMPIVSKAYYAARDFAKTTLNPPLGSGPYRIGTIKPGRSISFLRVPDYWGAALPLKRGRHNFDEIRFDYYFDRTTMVEALLSGDVEYHEEFTSKTWATAYDNRHVAGGWMIKDVLPDNTPSGVQAWFINTRLAKFRDRRVREALAYAFDFEWTNANIFYGLYRRMASYFENSELAARGLPGAGELALLEPYRGSLPDAAFTEPFEPPRSDGKGHNRRNLRRAKALLSEAGWVLRDGALVEASSGARMSVEMLYFEPTFERVIGPYRRNLERLGIEVKLRRVDSTQYVRRLQEHDFDLTTQRFVQQLSPGAELWNYFGSESADQIGSLNLSGVKDPMVDALIAKVLSATDRTAMVAASRALDRVLLWGHYIVPQWYKGVHHLVYWNKYGRPARQPEYSVGVLDTWWVDAGKEAKLRVYRGADE